MGVQGGDGEWRRIEVRLKNITPTPSPPFLVLLKKIGIVLVGPCFSVGEFWMEREREREYKGGRRRKRRWDRVRWMVKVKWRRRSCWELVVVVGVTCL